MELILHCPHCPSGKSPKLYINADKGVFNCFRCGFTGKLSRLREYPELFSSLEDRLSLAEVQRLKSYSRIEETSYSLLESLNPVREVYHTDPQYEYLISRGFTPTLIELYQPLVSLNPRFSNRVILPIFNASRELVYYTARDITGTLKEKYDNPKVTRAGIVFSSKVPENLLYADSAVLCEGIFDSFKVPNAIALLGKCLSDKTQPVLIDLLKRKRDIYVCLDAGAEANMLDLARNLSAYFPGKRVYTLNTDAFYEISAANPPDLGDLSKSMSSNALMTFIKTNSTLFTHTSLLDSVRARLMACCVN